MRKRLKASFGWALMGSFTENWKTFLKVSVSFCGSSLEKAGNSMVVIGVAKKVINTAKFVATA